MVPGLFLEILVDICVCENNVFIVSEVRVWNFNSTSQTSSKCGTKHAFSKPLGPSGREILGSNCSTVLGLLS
jgi:hypothetical protein